MAERQVEGTQPVAVSTPSLPPISAQAKPNPLGTGLKVIFEHWEWKVVLWSGLRKGPPRRLKFPDTRQVLDIMRRSVQLRGDSSSSK
ncbi:selenoprotein H, partial [Scyliorhinus torazame]|uniref:selenoprotein H n=1 Tax=Scyliorhinus torazame TaxID=75743 RepID=UPI003B59AC43